MESLRNFLKSKTFIVLLLIVLLGSFLRLYKLGEKSLVADEFLGVNAVYGFLQTGQFHRWDFNWSQRMQDEAYPKSPFEFDIWKGGPDTYTRAWIYNWQVAQSLRFFSPEKESSYRLISALWGIVLILLTYFAGWKISGRKKIGLLGAFFIAISLMSVELSRKMRMYAMFAPVFLVFCFYLYKFLESKKTSKYKFVELINKKTGFNFIYFIPAVLLGLLSAHLHLLALNIGLVLIFYWSVMALILYVKTKKLGSKYFYYLGIGLILSAVLFSFSKTFAMFPKLFLKFLTHFSYLEIIFSDYSAWILAVVLIVLGTYYLIREKGREGIFFSCVFWVILFLAMFLWKSNVGDRFIYFIKPFQVILLASGIYALAEYLRRNISQNAPKVFFLCLLFFALGLPNFLGFFGDDSPYVQNSNSSDPDYRKIFSYYMKKRNPNDVLVTRDFRNFYFKDAKVKVFSLGGERTDKEERRISLDDIKKISSENECGWVIYSDNDKDFITKEAQEFMDGNFMKVDNSSVRGEITVMKWCKNDEK